MDNYRKGIVVGGIPADLSEEALRLYFEDEARSGGGAVKKLRIDRSTSTAIVTFTAAEGQLKVSAIIALYIKVEQPQSPMHCSV